MEPAEGSTPTPTHHPLAESPAFRAAAVRSEERRAYVVLGAIAMAIALVLRPEAWRELDRRAQLAAVAGLGVLVVTQLVVLAFVSWARRRERSLPRGFVVSTVIVESLVPTGMMLFDMLPGALEPHAALNAPPLLAYGILITLTTLRLRPALCILSGVLSAAGYGALIVYVRYGLKVAEPTTGLPHAAYISNALMIVISGLAAAGVAYEIRRHVRAALREIETRREIDRIEQDIAVARSIQRALLPRSAPEIPGFDIAGWNRPAGQTGGDYYDWQALPDGNWIVTLADVSGHGVGPAMVTAACRAYVRASGVQHGDLASLTSRTNQLLANDLTDGRFVTMASVLINPRGGPVALLSAGHGPIVLYIRGTGAMQDIRPQGLPLAIAPEVPYGPAQSIDMAPGDVLALVTDGFVDWSRENGDGRREDFGLTRFREALLRHASLPAAAMIEAITADVAAFAQSSPQQDDLTMVVIRRVTD